MSPVQTSARRTMHIKINSGSTHFKIVTILMLSATALAGCTEGVSITADGNAEQAPIAYTDAYWAELAQSYPAFVAEPDVGALLPEDRIVKGRWGDIIEWPQIATGAANLPDGRIMTWSSTQEDNSPSGADFTHGSIYDPLSGQFTTKNNPSHDIFCAGVSMLADGQILAAGGGATIATTSIFDNNNWSLVQNMARPRWYPTLTTLPSGQAFSSLGGQSQPYPEVWTAGQGWQLQSNLSLQLILDDISADYGKRHWYPALNVTPDGSLFHPGPTSQLFSVDLSNAGAIIPHGPRESGNPFRLYNTTVMYDVGKMLVAGGGSPALASAMTIDLNSASPSVSPTNSMNYPRSMHNTTVLPDGTILVIGGNSSGIQFSDEGTQLTPELWDPQTGVWNTMAPHSAPRNYHSTALLLKDGRVASMGGGLCGNCATNHQSGQIFEPPYLFNSDGTAADRPVISNGPSSAVANEPVVLTGSDDIVSFNMLRLVALTHHHTTDQRLVPVGFQKTSAGNYQLNMPENPNVLIPGYYWVFGLNANGVPSEGHTIKIGISALSEAEQIAEPVNYEYYEGTWNVLPDFNSLTPKATGTLTSIALSPAQRPDNYAMRFSSSITVTEAGLYNFYTASDDGSQLFINGQLVVNNDGRHALTEKQGSINLSPGTHAIVVTFFESAGGERLDVMWAGPGFTKTDITGDLGTGTSTPTEPTDPTTPTNPTTNPTTNPASLQTVQYEYYHGVWTNLPDFNSLLPVSTGETDSFSLATAQRNQNFAFRFTSVLNVPVNGQYTFYTASDDGSQLFINGQLVVDNNGTHPLQEKQGSINLTSGTHAIEVTYFERLGEEVLNIQWEGPGFTKTDINSIIDIVDTTVGPIDPVQPPVNPIDPVTPVDPAANNLISNSTFEQGSGSWVRCSSSAVIELSSEAYSGQSALAVEGCAFTEFQLTENEAYTLSCRAKGNGTNYSSITLSVSDANFNPLASKDIVLDSQQYKLYTLQLTAPPGGVNGAVDFYAEGGAANFDDCYVVKSSSVPDTTPPDTTPPDTTTPDPTPPDTTTPTPPTQPTQPTQPTVPANNLLVNSTFEQNADGWFSCSSDTVIALSDQSYSGQNALAVKGCAYSEFSPVASQTYRLSCYAKANTTAYSSVTLSFSDAAYNRIGAVDVALDVDEYKEYILEFAAPAGSVNAAVDFYTESDVATLDDCFVVAL